MEIHVHTDNNVEGSDELVRRVEDAVGAALSRFSDQLTRVEVHLADESAGRSSGPDKRCRIEARPARQQPVAVTHHAATLNEAYSGAAQKLKNLLESQTSRLGHRKGGDTIRDSEQP